MQQTDNKKQLDAADNKESSKNSSQRVGIRKAEENLEGKTLNKLSLVGQTFHQPNSTNTAQMSSDEEVVNEDFSSKKPKTKWRRWKNQVRTTNKKRSNQRDLNNGKRASCDIRTSSLKSKRPKMASPSKCKPSRVVDNSPSAKLKLNWGVIAMEVGERLDSTVQEISAEAGNQPRRQQ